MTEKQLEYFKKAYECQNIAEAASALFVSRPVLSRAISSLEEEFGASLFVRDKNGVSATEAGKLLYQLAMDYNAAYSNTMEKIRAISNPNESMELKICTTPTNCMYITENILAGFSEKHPNIKIHISEQSAYNMTNILYDRKADFVFSPAQVTLPINFHSIDIYQSRIVAAISKDNPLSKRSLLSVSELFDFSLGCLAAPLPLESTLTSLAQDIGKKLSVSIRTSRTEILRKLTKENKLVAIMPDDMISSWDGVVGVPLEIFTICTHRMVWDSSRKKSTASLLFINYIKQTLSENSKRKDK